MKRIVQGLGMLVLMYGSMAQAWYIHNVGEEEFEIYQGTTVFDAYMWTCAANCCSGTVPDGGSGYRGQCPNATLTNNNANQLSPWPVKPQVRNWGSDPSGGGVVSNPNYSGTLKPGAQPFAAGPASTIVLIRIHQNDGGTTDFPILGPLSSPGTNDYNGGLMVKVVTAPNGKKTLQATIGSKATCLPVNSRYGAITNQTTREISIDLKWTDGTHTQYSIAPNATQARIINTVRNNQCLVEMRVIDPSTGKVSPFAVAASTISSADQDTPTALQIVGSVNVGGVAKTIYTFTPVQ